MSDNARPEPEQKKPAEPGPVDGRSEPVLPGNGLGAVPDAAGPSREPGQSAEPGRVPGGPTELLILPTDDGEPPIYFDPEDAEVPFPAPFAPAPSAAPAAQAVAGAVPNGGAGSLPFGEQSLLGEPLPAAVSPAAVSPAAVSPAAVSNDAVSNDIGVQPASLLDDVPVSSGAGLSRDLPWESVPSASEAQSPLAAAPSVSAGEAASSETLVAVVAKWEGTGPTSAAAPPSDPIVLPSLRPVSPSAASPSAVPSSAVPSSAVPSRDALPPSSGAARPSSGVVSRTTTSVPPPRVPRTGRSQRPGSTSASQRPGGMIEPARIIAVLGSEVPAYNKESAGGDEIEDLDASEAEELPEGASSEREPEKAAPAESALAETPAEAAASSAARDAQRRARPPAPPSARAAKKAAEESATRKPWWEDMFSDDFLRAIPVLSPPQLERETLFVERSLNVPRGGRILDLACGAGQHAVELSSHGYSVVGYDLSQAQLSWAAELAQERGQALEFVHGDMRDLEFNAAFEGIYCWNTSFGFFEEDKNINIAQRVLRSLRPGGRFLLDVVNRDFIVSQQPGQTWFEGDGCVCIDDVIVDFITSRIKVKRTLMLDNGRNRECQYSIRLYSLHELGKLLHDVGFRILQVSGRPELPGIFMGPTSPRIIILAVKPA